VKEAAGRAYQALEAGGQAAGEARHPGRYPCLGRYRRHGWEGREAYCVGNACRQGKGSRQLVGRGRQGGMAILAVGKGRQALNIMHASQQGSHTGSQGKGVRSLDKGGKQTCRARKSGT
jgi:hypothetical protein